MGIISQEKALDNLRKQLGVAVRSVQWSYAIFWSSSPSQPGVLEWTEGYYNGDIKTRKTILAEDVNADKLSLRRSEQLKDLYESLLEGESDLDSGGNKRPSASLSPEDLSDLEWYYLVCMSFVFTPGQGLPGRVLASGRSIWLCNAQDADSKLFVRSLLAKSASVQTVICFPHAEGVLELGITDMVPEDPNLIQHIRTSLLEFDKPVCSEKSSMQRNTDYDKNGIGLTIPDETDHETIEPEQQFTNLHPTSTKEIKFHEEMVNELHGTATMFENFNNNMDDSPDDDCSDMCCGGHNLNNNNNNLTEDSFMLDETEIDDLSHCFHDSIDSSGCISQAFEFQEKPLCSPKSKSVYNRFQLQELEVFNPARFGSLGLGNCNDDEDLHYKRIVAVILQSPSRWSFKSRSSLGNSSRGSSFIPWKREARVGRHSSTVPVQQRALKKMLFTVPLMIGRTAVKVAKEKQDARDWKPQPPDSTRARSNILSEKCRENEKYMVLGSIIPSINKIDKTSILNNTIEYLQELEARVEELESCINVSDSEAGTRRNKHNMDMVEQTSDNNYDHNNKNKSGRKFLLSKRKASDIDEKDTDDHPLQQQCTTSTIPLDDINKAGLDLKVNVRENEVVIEMRCCWREYLLLDIMDAVNSLNLDAHTVQSSTLDGILNLNLKSKFRGGGAFISAGMIKQALRRTVC